MSRSQSAETTPPSGRRPRGRPPKTIDFAQLADVVERLFANGGVEAVSIESAATEMGISRATLYRSVPTKEHLLGLLFERLTEHLGSAAENAVALDGRSARERLHALIAIHITAAVEMRNYMFVFFQGERLPGDVYANWRQWRRRYERIWQSTVREAAEAGVIRTSDPLVATRLLLGMCVWVSRWYRPGKDLPADEVARIAIELVDRGD